MMVIFYGQNNIYVFIMMIVATSTRLVATVNKETRS